MAYKLEAFEAFKLTNNKTAEFVAFLLEILYWLCFGRFSHPIYAFRPFKLQLEVCVAGLRFVCFAVSPFACFGSLIDVFYRHIIEQQFIIWNFILILHQNLKKTGKKRAASCCFSIINHELNRFIYQKYVYVERRNGALHSTRVYDVNIS